jgi:hypothetical protein
MALPYRKRKYFSSAAEEEIAKQFPTELWRVLKFSILHVVVIIISCKIGGTLFQTRRLLNHFSSLLMLGLFFLL